MGASVGTGTGGNDRGRANLVLLKHQHDMNACGGLVMQLELSE